MTYEELLTVADSEGLIAKEKDLWAYDGRIKGKRIAVRRSISTQRKKACVLAEELGHYYTGSGDILDQTTVEARRQEKRARRWAYDTQIGLPGLIRAKEAGCRTTHEAADYLDVPEGFLLDCIKSYHEKYGTRVTCQGYLIQFDPYMAITAQDALENDDEW